MAITGDCVTVLTGATGLLGRFLLKHLMSEQLPTIVLVRRNSRYSVAQRIDDALACFESHRLLPRPWIVEADLNRPALGLDSTAIELLAQHPVRIIHSAASIRFRAEEPAGEPYASNVAGTRHLLDACRNWTVREFHHISTAYVQCDRTRFAVAKEIPVAKDADAGNDYERSKILAEDMVQQCPWLGRSAIYRPSIIVGDSRTGYSSTFHGFYAPLQIGAQLARTSGFDSQAGNLFRERLGLSVSDAKNLVPVDWVAAAILELANRCGQVPEKIFHLTHPQPASLHDIQSAILDALEHHFGNRAAKSSLPDVEHLEMFREQMDVYESYFQNDPPFDRTHAARYLTSLPCPPMDYAALRRLADFALQGNFGWPRPAPRPQPQANLAVHSVPWQSLNQTQSRVPRCEDAILEVLLLGSPGDLRIPLGPWRFARGQAGWRVLKACENGAPSLTLVTSEAALRECLNEKIDPACFFGQGRWVIQGVHCQQWLEIVRDWVQHVTVSPHSIVSPR